MDVIDKRDFTGFELKWASSGYPLLHKALGFLLWVQGDHTIVQYASNE